jgi:hypothetical protein
MNRTIARLVSILVFTAGCADGAVAAETPAVSDAANFVSLTRALEADPMRDTTKEIRSWLIDWLTESPTVSVKVCVVMDFLQGSSESDGALLMTQSLFGNAAFQIEHPGNQSDQLAQQLAGIESMLKAYSSLRRASPGKHYQQLDTLMALQKSGELKPHLAPLVEQKCQAKGGASRQRPAQ